MFVQIQCCPKCGYKHWQKRPRINCPKCRTPLITTVKRLDDPDIPFGPCEKADKCEWASPQCYMTYNLGAFLPSDRYKECWAWKEKEKSKNAHLPQL